MTDCPREDNKQKSTVFVVSTSNSGVSSHSSTSGLHAGPSASEGNEHHLSPDDIRFSPKAGVRKETRNRKSKVSALLTDTPVKAQVGSKVKAHRKSAKRSRLFSGSQEKSRKSSSYEGAFEGMRHLKRKMTVNDFVLLCRAPTKWIQCIECHKWAHGHCAGFSDFLFVGNATVDRNGDFESEY